MKIYRRVVRILAFATIGCCTGVFSQAGDNDAKLFHGKWRVVSATANGAPYPHDRVEKMRVVFDKDSVRVYLKGTNSVQAARFAIDAKPSPKHIDFTELVQDREWTDRVDLKLFRRYKRVGDEVIVAEGHAKGIYKFDGDRLTLCWRTTEGFEPGAKNNKLSLRPNSFQSVLYYHQFLFVLERIDLEKPSDAGARGGAKVSPNSQAR